MGSAWIAPRKVKNGVHYRVLYRTGGRKSPSKHGGQFKTIEEAELRREWIAKEIAAVRMPEQRLDVSGRRTILTINWDSEATADDVLTKSREWARLISESLPELEVRMQILSSSKTGSKGGLARAANMNSAQRSEAARKAGLGRAKIWGKEDILKAIQDFHKKNGRSPTSQEWDIPGDHPSKSRVRRTFGTWSNAIEEAGFPRPNRGGSNLLNELFIDQLAKINNQDPGN